jgi:DNA-binding transcriptional regulator YdaS (Cro superfamily)
VVGDASTLARLAGVTQPRMTQILNLNLNLLAPEIQEALLYGECMPEVLSHEKGLRGLSLKIIWQEQMRIWMGEGLFLQP